MSKDIDEYTDAALIDELVRRSVSRQSIGELCQRLGINPLIIEAIKDDPRDKVLTRAHLQAWTKWAKRD